MPKENKSAEELSFDAGFETKVVKGVECHVYSDKEVFKKNSPVDEATIKQLHNYEKGFNTKFIETCVDDAKKAFKTGADQRVYQVQNGINHGSELNVSIKKSCTFTSGFGDDKKTITAPKINVAVKRSGLYNKSRIDEVKKDLKSFVDSL